MKYVIYEESISWAFEERSSGEEQVNSCLTNFNPGKYCCILWSVFVEFAKAHINITSDYML